MPRIGWKMLVVCLYLWKWEAQKRFDFSQIKYMSLSWSMKELTYSGILFFVASAFKIWLKREEIWWPVAVSAKLSDEGCSHKMRLLLWVTFMKVQNIFLEMPMWGSPHSIFKIYHERSSTILRKNILKIRRSKYGDGPGILFLPLLITQAWAASVFTKVLLFPVWALANGLHWAMLSASRSQGIDASSGPLA